MNFTISNPRFENRDAILTYFPERKQGAKGTLTLLVDRPGEHTLTMDWSARAEARPEGLVVDLRVPTSPAASLELELPVDRTLTVVDRAIRADQSEAIVSGPHPADAADRRIWRIACGGRSQLSLLLRRTITTPSESVVLCSQKMVQEISPDGVESMATFTLEALRQGVRELRFVLDSTLRPTHVTADDLEGWRIEPGPNGTTRLIVRLLQPLQQGSVEIRCLSALGPTPMGRTTGQDLLMPWTSPAIRLERATPRGETLEVILDRELRFLTWEPGDFRLTDSALIAKPGGKAKRRWLKHQGGGIAPAGGEPRRPGGTLQIGSVEYNVDQQLWWRPRAETMELTARIAYSIRQGQMFQLPLRLPARWDIDSVELDPPNQLRGWGVRGAPDEQTLLVDLRQPFVPRAEGGISTGTLIVRLRPRETGPWTGRDVPFPDLIPLGARQRNGGIAIDFDGRLYQGQIQTSLPVGEAPPVPLLWGDTIPDNYYPFQGAALIGTFRSSIRPARSRANVHAETVVLPDRLSVEATVRLEALAGETTEVSLFVSGAEESGADWEWTVADKRPAGPRIRRVSRRLERDCVAVCLLAGSVLNRLTLAAAVPKGSSWRIEFDRPLRVDEPMTLIGRSTRVRGPDALVECSIPLVSVREASSLAGDISLTFRGAEIVSKTSHGVRESGKGSYRWSDTGAWLRVQTRAIGTSQIVGATIDRACMTSVLTLQQELRHYARFRVAGWNGRLFPVGLPSEATLLAASTFRCPTRSRRR